MKNKSLFLLLFLTLLVVFSTPAFAAVSYVIQSYTPSLTLDWGQSGTISVSIENLNSFWTATCWASLATDSSWTPTDGQRIGPRATESIFLTATAPSSGSATTDITAYTTCRDDLDSTLVPQSISISLTYPLPSTLQQQQTHADILLLFVGLAIVILIIIALVCFFAIRNREAGKKIKTKHRKR